jgi:hypothetical protein
MFLLGEGERFCERQEGAPIKGEYCRKERDCIKVICHPTSATVCKRNQKVDKKGWFHFLGLVWVFLAKRELAPLPIKLPV